MDASGMVPPKDGSDGRRRMPGPDEPVKEGPDNRPKAEKVETWSKMKMDDRTAAAIVAYCNDYAAPPTETTLTRSGRVKKRQLLGWNHAFYETPGRPRGLEAEPTTGEEGLRSYGSFSSESSGMCIGFSPSGRIAMVCTKPENERGSGRSSDGHGGMGEDETSTGGGYGGRNAEDSGRVGVAERGEMDARDNQDMRPMGYDRRNQVSSPRETDEARGTRSNTSQMVDDSRSLSRSSSMDTLDILMDCPPLVGYYMRREEYLTKNGWPSPPTTPSTTPPRSPFPGLTIEQVYDGYANSWDVEQNWLWRRALRDPARQYVGDGMLELEPEVEAEPKLESKKNVFARMGGVVWGKVRGLLKL
ncbi:hypothetical protein FS749_013518 [Ceratobasidium sp. UAMH 11750]|nr:hypothetical protein FS749_013518 [Ceratobasidium sp. UAMH 11750]